MVPKLHKKGTSFKGAAAYLLHDKEASTSERVEWIETRNLVTDDPDLAWRIMAATALDQNRLKANAGVRSTGRKSADSVLHYSLSWHESEKADLTPEEMMRAARESIRALGASDRQALIICHNDEQHPHLHVVINRVSPADGRMLSSSKEKLALSKWAEGYETRRGRILCEERVVNNALRARGEFTRAVKDKPRHIYEAEQRAARQAQEKPDGFEVIRAEQRAKDAALSERGRALQERHARQWDALRAAHKERRQEIRDSGRKAAGQAKKLVREAYRDRWRALYRAQRGELEAFHEREAGLLGKVQNALRAVDLSRHVTGVARGAVITEAFRYLSSAGARLQALKDAHEAARKDLGTRQDADIRKGLQKVREQRAALLSKNRQRLMAERGQLMLSQKAENAVLRGQWKARTEERRAAIEAFREEVDRTLTRTARREIERDDPPERKQEAPEPRERRRRRIRTRRSFDRDRDDDGADRERER